MYNEKDIKLTINKLWREMKEIKLEQNNAVYSIGIRTSQIFVLMKVLNKEDIFSKEEVNEIFKDTKQVKLTEVRNVEFTDFVNNIKSKDKTKTKQKIISDDIENIPEMKVKPKV